MILKIELFGENLPKQKLNTRSVNRLNTHVEMSITGTCGQDTAFPPFYTLPPYLNFHNWKGRLNINDNILHIKQVMQTNDNGYVQFVVINIRSFPNWLFTWFVTRLTRWVPHVEQELLTLPEHPSSRQLLSEFHVHVARSLVVCVMFCRSLFFLLYLFSFGHCIVYPYSIFKASGYPFAIFKLFL